MEKEVEIVKDANPGIQGNQTGREDNKKDELEVVNKPTGAFGLSISELQGLMGAYKERGKDCQDLTLMDSWGGAEGMMEKLKTDPKNGISSTDGRVDEFGSNAVYQEPVPSFCFFVWESLSDTMLRILIVAAIVQIILGATLSDSPETDWIDGMSIVFAVLVVTLVGSITNYEKAKKFHELNDLQAEGTKYQVVRGGSSLELKSDDLLVGDLVNIVVGEIIPADMFIINSNGIKIDESALTGESDTLKKEPLDKCKEERDGGKKNPASPCVLSGTNCVEGTGQGIVIAVGDYSQKGIIKRTVDNAQENNKTPLEEKLEKIAQMIGYFGLASGIVTLIALVIRFGIQFPKDKKEHKDSKRLKDLVAKYMEADEYAKDDTYFKDERDRELTDPKDLVAGKILEIVLLCVAIIVVAIPEGLPLAVSLSLAFSIKKLMEQNNLVRKMHSCETMGGANYICTDKTGTLTRNEMNIFKVFSPGTELLIKETLEVADAGNLDAEKGQANKKIREDHSNYFKCETFWTEMKRSIALNIEGGITFLDQPTPEGDTETLETKNKTDKAFIDFLYRFKSPISVERNTYIADDSCIKRVPFDSKRKRMMSCVKSPNFPTGYRVFSKGGAEKVKESCSKYMDINDGSIKTLGDAEMCDISNKIEKFNKAMLRSLYVSYRDITEEEYNNYDKEDSNGKCIDQHDMIFVCIVGIRDSLRNGVKEAVERCHRAGVTVIMVTGDNIITATAIAKEANILGQDVDLENAGPEIIEQEPELTNDPSKREEHLKEIIKSQPKALTGNTFFAAIHGLYCSSCGKDTNSCTCARSQSEAKMKKEEAKKKGLDEKEILIRNETIREEDMPTFKALVKNLRVMGRSQPIHKYTLITGLRKLGFICGVTGDGTNDAPALSKSNVGFCMAIDIAKDASDIIIMDNNFASIVVAIIYGRNIYDNIRRFLQFQLTVNFSACLLVFLCAVIGNESPLNAVQMLWVNLIMDSLGSLALATEPPYDELLDRPPTKKSESIINGKMWKHIILQAIFQLAILIVLYLIAPEFIKEDNLRRKGEAMILLHCYGEMPGGKTDPDYILYGISGKWKSSAKLKLGLGEAQCGKYSERQDLSVAFKAYCNAWASSTHIAIVFNVFVIYTLFNEINARVLDDTFNIFQRIHKNLFFPLITLVELGLQIIIVQFSNMAFKVVEQGMTAKQWGIAIGFSASTFVLSAIFKLIPLDIPIQKWLDKDNKVANEEENKEAQKSSNELINKSGNEISVLNNNSKEKLNKPQSQESVLALSDNNLKISNSHNSKKNQGVVQAAIEIGTNMVDAKIQKKESSAHKGEGSLRQNKAEVPI